MLLLLLGGGTGHGLPLLPPLLVPLHGLHYSGHVVWRLESLESTSLERGHPGQVSHLGDAVLRQAPLGSLLPSLVGQQAKDVRHRVLAV